VALAFVFTSGLTVADDTQHRSQLRQLRFSWDGKYVLAQDDFEITVLTADPFAVLFRVPAGSAALAQFTPDSKEFTFISSITRADSAVINVARDAPNLQRWSVGGRRLVASMSLPRLVCRTMAVVSDARTLACVDFEGTLRVLDLASGQAGLEIRRFSGPIFFWIGLQRHDFDGGAGAAKMAASPDGRFVVAVGLGGPGRGRVVVWDTTEGREVKLAGRLGALRNAAVWNMQFAFVGRQRLVMSCGTWQKQYVVAARIVSFPDGATSSTAKIPWGPELLAAADPQFLIVVHPYYSEFAASYYGSYRFPYPSEGAAAVDLATGEMIITNTPVIDVFGSRYVTEVRPGVVGLHERGRGLQASVVLRQ